MEQYSQSQYLMWMRSNKHILNSHLQASMNSFSNSWEEQAFAEDGAGPLGGFIWPPRSYSCSFCKREFRSAQALGGHMNVHRRDRARARLKQSPHSLRNPNSTKDETATLSPFTSSIVKEVDEYGVSDNSKSALGEVDPRKDENHDDYVLCVGLNMVVSQNQQTRSDCEEAVMCYKKHKSSTSTVSSYPLFSEPPRSSHRYGLKSEALGVISMEDIDLELRLGNSPKVK